MTHWSRWWVIWVIMSNHGVIKWEKVRYHLIVYKESKSPAFTATVTSWLLIMTHMTHHRDQWVTSYKMNTMTSWLRHHFRSLPVWSWPEVIFMGFSERRIFYWSTSHKKFFGICHRFRVKIAKLLLPLKKWTLGNKSQSVGKLSCAKCINNFGTCPQKLQSFWGS